MRYYVDDQPRGREATWANALTGLGAQHGRSVLHGRMRTRRCLHFAQLDAKAAQLHLVVQASKELNGAVGQVARLVAGTVEPCARRGAERIGNEALGSHIRPIEIASSQIHAANIQLTWNAYRHRPQPLIEQVDLRVGDGSSDGNAAAPVARQTGPSRDVYRRLRWAVQIVQLDAREPSMKTVRELGG